MFLLYVLGVFAISLFGSQCQPETRDTVFQCKSWGDPHIQTWHPKNGDKIQQRDCYLNGHHDLIHNDIISMNVKVHSRYVTHANVKFHDVRTGHLLLHLELNASSKPTVNNTLRQQHGVQMTVTTVGSKTTTNFLYSAGQVSLVFEQVNGRYENIQISVPRLLAEQSTGMCAVRDAACNLRGVGTDEPEWQPVRSGSTKQIFTNAQAEIICNEHINEYFAKIHPAPYQRDAHVNSMVTNILAGCIEDVVLTGEIEVAQSGMSVLMIDELTKDATTIDAIQAAIESGLEEASFLLNDAVKTANAKVRKMF